MAPTNSQHGSKMHTVLCSAPERKNVICLRRRERIKVPGVQKTAPTLQKKGVSLPGYRLRRELSLSLRDQYN